MSTAVQRRGGTTAQHASFVGLDRELTVDTTKKTVVVHDGVTAGGIPLARADAVAPGAQAVFPDISDSAGTVTLSGAFKALLVASAVNFVSAAGAVAGSAPVLTFTGADTNVSGSHVTKGTGVHDFYTNGGTRQFQVGHTASAVNYVITAGGSAGNRANLGLAGSDTNVGLNINLKGSESVVIQGPASAPQFLVAAVSSAVNYLSTSGTTTGIRTTLAAAGSDTNLGVTYSAKGNELHVFNNNSGATQTVIGGPASTANYLNLRGEVAGSAPNVNVSGTDANINLNLNAKGTGAVYLRSAGGNQFSATDTASSVNWLQASGAATGFGPLLSAVGSDANIPMQVRSKGTGEVQLMSAGTGAVRIFTNSGAEQVRVEHSASSVNYVSMSGGATGIPPSISSRGSDTDLSMSLNVKGSGSIFLTTGGTAFTTQMKVAHTASAVNYTYVRGGVAGSPVIYGVEGADTNIGQYMVAKGSASYQFTTNAGATEQFRIESTASAVNFPAITGGATGQAPALVMRGADTNVGLYMASKGSGNITFNSGAAENQFQVTATTTAVNRVSVTGATTGNAPRLTVAGSDANVALNMSSKGSGDVVFYSSDFSLPQFAVLHVGSSVNYMSAQGAPTGSGASMRARGVDSDVAASLWSKGNAGVSLVTGGTGNVEFSTNNGTLQHRVAHTASAVDYWVTTGSASGNIDMYAAGASSNISQRYHAKGTGIHHFLTGTYGSASTQFQIGHTASAVNFASATGGTTGSNAAFNIGGVDANVGFDFNAKNAGEYFLRSNGGIQFVIGNTASAVNAFRMVGGVAGNDPVLIGYGSDTDVSVRLSSKGAGVIRFFTSSNSAEQFRVAHVASAVNYTYAGGSVAGGSVQIGAQGSDANVSMNLTPKGRGHVGINTAAPVGRLSIGGQAIINALATLSAVDTSTDIVTTVAAHGFTTGDMAVYRTTATALTAAGTAASDRFFYLNCPSGTTFTLHSTMADALAGASKIDITANGTGTQTFHSASMVLNTGVNTGNGSNTDLLHFRHTAGTDWTGVSSRIQMRTDNTPQGFIEFNPQGNTYGTKVGATSTGIVQLATAGGTQVEVINAASAVNRVTLAGGATGQGVLLAATGSDSNVEMAYNSKGTFGHAFSTGGSYMPQFKVVHTASAVNFVKVTGGATGGATGVLAEGTDTDVQLTLEAKGGGAVAMRTGGGMQAAFVNTASAVNYLQITGGAAGNGPRFEVAGTDTNVGMGIYSKGTSPLMLGTANGTVQLRVNHTASAVNYMTFTGGIAGNGASLSTLGSDTNVDMFLASKGGSTVGLQINGNTQFRASGPASAVNFLQATGNTTGNGVTLSAQGGDSNVNLFVNGKGNGAVVFQSQGSVQMAVYGPVGSVNYMEMAGSTTGNRSAINMVGSDAGIGLNLNMKANGSCVFTGQSGAVQFLVASVASAVNYLYTQGSTAGNRASLIGTGADTNVGVTYFAKGNELHVFSNNGGATQCTIGGPASTNNYVNLSGNIAGSGVSVAAVGVDANIDLNLTAKGSGRVINNGVTLHNGLYRDLSKDLDATNALTAKTIASHRTCLSGTAGASLALTLPAASATIDGQEHIIISTTARPSTTWASSGATFVGTPAALTAGVSVTVCYNHATTQWFIS